MRDRELYLLAEAYQKVNENSKVPLQQVQLATQTGLRTLIASVFNDPQKFWDLLKKTPGLYGALLTGNVNRVKEIFLSLGVDMDKINDTVAKSMELFQQYQRGTPVEVRKAIKIPQSYETNLKL